MTHVRILQEAELRELASFDLEALAAVERAFFALAEGRATMPPIMHLEVAQPRGDIDIKSAVIEGLPILAVKIGAGFFGNRHLGLPSSSAMMVAISTRTGRCEAVLLDNGYLTDLRTALAGAVAARHLARAGSLDVGIIGAGVQARYQLEALMIERRVKRVRVWAPRIEQAECYAVEMEKKLRLEVKACPSVEAVGATCELIVTTTPATSALIQGIWLRPGHHITAVGSDLPGKRELDQAALDRADRLVCDDLAQSLRIGELQHASDASARHATSLGDIITGRAPARNSPGEITICDLSGTGAQDTAIADYVLKLTETQAALSEIAPTDELRDLG